MKIAIYIEGTLNKEYDMIIGVEQGAVTLKDKIDLAIADFDSITKEELASLDQSKVIKLSEQKDDTDVQAAIKEALKHNPELIDVYLPEGNRDDHLITNFALLNIYDNVVMYTKNSVMKSGMDFTISNCKYFSIYPLENCELKISGAKYDYEGYVSKLDPKFVSNEPVKNTAVHSTKKIIVITTNK